MAPSLPTPLRVLAGLVGTTLDRVRNLPQELPALGVGLAGQAFRLGLKVRQEIAGLAVRGDDLLSGFSRSSDKPAWATFDEDTPEPTRPVPSPAQARTPDRPGPRPTPPRAADRPDAAGDPHERRGFGAGQDRPVPAPVSARASARPEPPDPGTRPAPEPAVRSAPSPRSRSTSGSGSATTSPRSRTATPSGTAPRARPAAGAAPRSGTATAAGAAPRSGTATPPGAAPRSGTATPPGAAPRSGTAPGPGPASDRRPADEPNSVPAAARPASSATGPGKTLSVTTPPVVSPGTPVGSTDRDPLELSTVDLRESLAGQPESVVADLLRREESGKARPAYLTLLGNRLTTLRAGTTS